MDKLGIGQDLIAILGSSHKLVKEGKIVRINTYGAPEIPEAKQDQEDAPVAKGLENIFNLTRC